MKLKISSINSGGSAGLHGVWRWSVLWFTTNSLNASDGVTVESLQWSTSHWMTGLPSGDCDTCLSVASGNSVTLIAEIQSPSKSSALVNTTLPFSVVARFFISFSFLIGSIRYFSVMRLGVSSKESSDHVRTVDVIRSLCQCVVVSGGYFSHLLTAESLKWQQIDFRDTCFKALKESVDLGCRSPVVYLICANAEWFTK